MENKEKQIVTKENKYHRGKIYKLVTLNDDSLVYYGSTTQSLPVRLGGHIRDYRRHLAGNFNYVRSFDILAKGEYKIILVEEYPCDNREQLESREFYYIKNNKCCNKVHPTRTRKQYREDNKEKTNKYNKQYYDANKKKRQIKNDCICGGTYTNEHKISHSKSKKHQAYLLNSN